MIGAVIEAVYNLTGLRKGGLDTEKLFSFFSDEQIIHLLPSLDFAERRKFMEGSQSDIMIDYFSKIFFSDLPPVF